MKKGFTLIELLAVILILGIIALIAIPQVTNVIENANKGAAETSAKHYIDAVTNTLGLNKYDNNKENNITDGIKNVEELDVSISGEAPKSGILLIENGSVKTANLLVKGYVVDCNSNGKCIGEKGEYAYSISASNFTSLKNSTSTRPMEKNTYLKTKLINGDISEISVCIYEEGEFCLTKTNFEDMKTKVLNRFGYDSTWHKKQGSSNVYVKDDADTSIYCQYYTGYVKCSNHNVYMSVQLNNNNPYIYSGDIINNFRCGNSTHANCWTPNP